MAKTLHPCPVCGKYTFEGICSFDICPECGWQDDRIDTDLDDYEGANEMSLPEYRAAYQSGWRHPGLLELREEEADETEDT